MPQPVERKAEPAKSPLQPIEHPHVAGQQPHQGDRCLAGPEPLHPGLPRRYAAPQQEPSIEGGIHHHHLGLQIRPRLPEGEARLPVTQQQLTMLQVPKQPEHQLPRKAIEQGDGGCELHQFH
ncbi:hypothetical protein D3C84_1002840 [compost metagenome]